MHHFRSGHSSSQEPPQADSNNVGVPMPKSSHRIRELLRFGRSHSQKPPSYQPLVGQNIQTIHESRNITVNGSNNNVNYINTFVNSSHQFMEKLLEKTIQGAAFDSSARDPPPRCHPGTRLAILARCLEFIADREDEKNMLWVVGQAGVGKSAIMQTIAESSLPSLSHRASIFLSINGRNNGSKIIITLIYQLAAKCKPYREFIELEITREPSLLQSSMSVQFQKFLIESFIDNSLLNSIGHILILVDGLDECDKPETQRELLRLITDMCSAHPSSPVIWIVASRPEHHITSFLARDNVRAVYKKEEIEIDSDEARSDVEKLLRDELMRIQEEFGLSPGSQWPKEQDFWKLASASGGLFVYAQTVTKYIGALTIADPVSQLDDILKVIDALPLSNIPQEQHPLALLDALYARVLAQVPERIRANTRKILLALVLDSIEHQESRDESFLVLCNWLGMTCDEAYAAVRHLSSVLDAPTLDNAHEGNVRPFHKSFLDYLSDFTRSGFSSDIEDEARQLDVQCTIRILEQAPGGIDCGGMDSSLRLPSGHVCGTLACVLGGGSNIVVTWSADEDDDWSDNKTRLQVYKWACSNAIQGIRTGQSVFCTEFYIRTVTTQLAYYERRIFPSLELLDLVFEESRQHGFVTSGLLKRVPIKDLDFTRMTWGTILRFRHTSGTTTTNLSHPWKPTCEHERYGDWEEGRVEDWTTEFEMNSDGCHFCRRRLDQQLEIRKNRPQDHDVMVLFTSAQVSYVKFQFTDPGDGVSEWTYWIVLKIPAKKRRKPGSVV